ncbi:MAG: type IV secretion protein IcmV [Legionella sp.]|nr:MAG: type IV secretion protein IcmV [Legionella sp.]PJD98070.1 MAG: type IV secretion protein IcmV [Legionella sp.]
MKKKSKSRVASVITKILDFRKWSDLDRMKVFTAFVQAGFNRLFTSLREKTETPKDEKEGSSQASSEPSETFIAAQKKLNLNEQDLFLRQKALFRLSLLMLSLTLLIMGYAVYQLFQGAFHAFIVSVGAMSVAAALTFRYHFWYYQIKKRKLGCSMSEWFRDGLLGEKK